MTGMGAHGLHGAHNGANQRSKNMRLPKHVKHPQAQGQQYQMTPIDAVNIIQKFRNELDREGSLMSEIERKFGVVHEAERPQGQIGQPEFADLAHQAQLRLIQAQTRAPIAPTASWKTRFNSMSKTTASNADING